MKRSDILKIVLVALLIVIIIMLFKACNKNKLPEKPESIENTIIEIARGKSLTLKVIVDEDCIANWYNEQYGGDLINTGNTFTISDIEDSTKYWVEAVKINDEKKVSIERLEFVVNVINAVEEKTTDISEVSLIVDSLEGKQKNVDVVTNTDISEVKPKQLEVEVKKEVFVNFNLRQSKETTRNFLIDNIWENTDLKSLKIRFTPDSNSKTQVKLETIIESGTTEFTFSNFTKKNDNTKGAVEIVIKNNNNYIFNNKSIETDEISCD